MARRRGSRLTEDQVRRMVELDRQGQSISAIARAVGCHRQTVKAYLTGRRGDILADEIKKQSLTDEQQKHLDDLTEFAASLRSHLTIPDSPTEDRDAAAVLDPLLPKELPQGFDWTSQKVRREQRQTERKNKMLFESLRQHTSGEGWWQVFEEWQEVWNTCRNALRELRGEAYELVPNLINQKTNLKVEVERQSSKGRDELRSIADDMLQVVWRAGTDDKPVKEYKFQTKGDQVVAVLSDGSHYAIGSEGALSQDKEEICKLAFKTLCQSFSDKHILEMLQRMDEKIEEIDEALDPFILRPLLVRTRCTLCSV